jgi:hypothetical protein
MCSTSYLLFVLNIRNFCRCVQDLLNTTVLSDLVYFVLMHACYAVSKLLYLQLLTAGNHGFQSFTGCHEAYVCWHLGMQEV